MRSRPRMRKLFLEKDLAAELITRFGSSPKLLERVSSTQLCSKTRAFKQSLPGLLRLSVDLEVQPNIEQILNGKGTVVSRHLLYRAGSRFFMDRRQKNGELMTTVICWCMGKVRVNGGILLKPIGSFAPIKGIRFVRYPEQKIERGPTISGARALSHVDLDIVIWDSWRREMWGYYYPAEGAEE